MAKHYSARGEPIDLDALIARHADVKALGNAKMNARGDIIDQSGVVLKTQEQIEAEWAEQKAREKLVAGQPKNLKAPLDQVVGKTKAPIHSPMMQDQNFEPDVVSDVVVPEEVKPATKPTRRKIVETE